MPFWKPKKKKKHKKKKKDKEKAGMIMKTHIINQQEAIERNLDRAE